MKRLHRRFTFPLAFSASLMLIPATCGAQLVPPGDFRGKSLDQWGFDYSLWSIKTDLGGQTLPDTVDGVRYLPSFTPDAVNRDFVTSLTISHGTALLGSPFFVFGEEYDDGTSDPVDNDLINDFVFAGTTLRILVDGNIVLAGSHAEFEARKWGITVFPAPVLYSEPRVVDPSDPLAHKAVAAIYSVGFTTIYDGLTVGAHTIKHEQNSPFFGGEFTFTYNVTVVPEPSCVVLATVSGVGLLAVRRRNRRREIN